MTYEDETRVIKFCVILGLVLAVFAAGKCGYYVATHREICAETTTQKVVPCVRVEGYGKRAYCGAYAAEPVMETSCVRTEWVDR